MELIISTSYPDFILNGLYAKYQAKKVAEEFIELMNSLAGEDTGLKISGMERRTNYGLLYLW